MELKYVSADGLNTIDLLNTPICAQNPEVLADHAWQYTSIMGVNNKSRIKRFFQELQETSLTLSIYADSAEAFNELMRTNHSIFEKDINAKTPGKIWWNDRYKEVFVFESVYTDFDEYLEAIEHEITLVSPNPFWIKETTSFFCIISFTTLCDSQISIHGSMYRA